MYLFQEKLLDLNTHLDMEIQLLGLLNQYGGKFSSYQVLFHDFTTDQSDIDNSISNYLKCILYLFKLNLPTLFLNSNNTSSKQLNRNVILRESITSLSTSSGSASGSRYSANSLNSHSSSCIALSSSSSSSISSILNLKQTTQSFIQCFKRDMKQNLNELIQIIQIRFDESSLEANLFTENIQIALDYLSRF